MKIIKQPWFIILTLVAAIYTYQFYQSPKSFQLSTNKAQATSQTDGDNQGKNQNVETIKVNTSESFKVKGIDSFHLTTYRSLKLKFSKSDSEEILVSLVGEGAEFKNEGKKLEDWFLVTTKDKQLLIKSPGKNQFKDFSSMKDLGDAFKEKDEPVNLTMIVEFPESFKFKNIEVEGVSTDVYGSDLKLQKFKSATVSGDITLLNSQIEEIETNSVSGDNKFEVEGLRKASFSSVSGDTTLICKNTTPAVKFDSVSGDMDLKLPSDGEIAVSFESMTGELTNAFGTAIKKGSAINFSSLSGDASIGKIQ